MPTSVFGRIVHAGLVENAVRDTLKDWLSTFLAEIEDQNGLAKGTIERPPNDGCWVRTTDPRAIKATHFPTVAIQSDGWAGEPEWDDTDDTGPVASIPWHVAVTIYAKGRNRDETLDHVRMLIAAAGETLVARGSLDGFATQTDQDDEEYGVIDANRESTLAGAEAVFTVRVPRARNRQTGPAAPEPFPPEAPSFPDYGDHPEATTVVVTPSHLDEEP